jgi:hypothetical protein
MEILIPKLAASHIAIQFPSARHFNPCASSVGKTTVLSTLYEFGACSVSISCGPGRDSSANVCVELGRNSYPFVENFGSRISTLRLEIRDQMVTLDEKSENSRTSSFVRPNSAFTILPLPPLPLFITALQERSVMSQTRVLSPSQRRTRVEGPTPDIGDHRIIPTFPDAGILRTDWKEEEVRISRCVLVRIARWSPSGEGLAG